MRVSDIETLPEVREAANVLAELEKCGLVEPAIASGWTRGFLTDVSPSDIDVAYVGPVPHEQAREHLRRILSEHPTDLPNWDWDVDGIWNAETAYKVMHTCQNYLLYYINSIDSIYLAADGRLHDPTGYGFADAPDKTLRINMYDRTGRKPSPKEEVYICLEGCRRIAKFGWQPTAASATRITEGVRQWEHLTNAEQAYYRTKKIMGKYTPAERAEARLVYSRYGWAFVFD